MGGAAVIVAQFTTRYVDISYQYEAQGGPSCLANGTAGLHALLDPVASEYPSALISKDIRHHAEEH